MAKITPEIKKVIEGNIVAFATANKKGEPHVIAVGDVKVVAPDTLLVGDIYMEKSLNNLKDNNTVSLVVWDKDYLGFTLFGRVEYFSRGQWLDKAKEIHQGYSVKGAILVKILEIAKLK